jgi:hypothetical protein
MIEYTHLKAEVIKANRWHTEINHNFQGSIMSWFIAFNSLDAVKMFSFANKKQSQEHLGYFGTLDCTTQLCEECKTEYLQGQTRLRALQLMQQSFELN